jgi:hypothetical protein
MSDQLGAGDGGQRGPLPQFSTCRYCGGFTRRLSLLDSREGKNYRLLRCLSCEKVGWTEEE